MKNTFIISRPMVLTLVMLVITIGFSFGQEMPKFNTAEEKMEWIEKNPDEYNRLMRASSQDGTINSGVISQGQRTNVDLPGFPVFVNTGNPEADNLNYQNAKKAWVENNQKVYNAQFEELDNKNSIQKSSSVSDIPGFPKLIDTGNPELDNQKYLSEKTKWYSENNKSTHYSE